MVHRIYEAIISKHIATRRQMLFLVGARQVGKTTLSKWCADKTENFHYLNWDDVDVKDIITKGTAALGKYCRLGELYSNKSIVVFDEIHKYPNWKNFLKGFFDLYEDKVHIIVTGSARLDVYQKGGDSLMGRYIPYHIHPLSLRELMDAHRDEHLIVPTCSVDKMVFDRLIEFGGFPEPYSLQDPSFSKQWLNLRQQQVLYEDIQEVSHIRDTANLKLFAELLSLQVGQELNYSNMAKKIGVSNDSIRSWAKVLSEFYYCFTIAPWHKNVSRSLTRQPKVYLWDWLSVNDQGARYENLVASHLFKVINWFNDLGIHDLGLFYIRTKDQEEVDFLIVKDGKPWMLVEVKSSSGAHLSKHLVKYHEQLQTEHAFQVVFDKPYVDKDVFQIYEPMIIPVQNLLVQLI